ncbi:hypothetical protein TTHERM_000442589 (macronuclear) [Tetrahymena thermophila SB210]|uniref:Uncharacterized protein n=1 Tax=Tetrahymena thermophila (strain SB210) TaxID=312017 RepID=W7X9G8_TETTS|nr:hypothetical protein TTHERM_000442589 [Tetrahymena thermophila SB210]EWS74002.1 hypothetical protein TTHERM_000442589 [Tetrahymena thermophila SB210]|eukprot:XP_012653464.1 hypothetical protein TTHERM_000442589 [Tetrahymena thermophila SB210]
MIKLKKNIQCKKKKNQSGKLPSITILIIKIPLALNRSFHNKIENFQIQLDIKNVQLMINSSFQIRNFVVSLQLKGGGEKLNILI